MRPLLHGRLNPCCEGWSARVLWQIKSKEINNRASIAALQLPEKLLTLSTIMHY